MQPLTMQSLLSFTADGKEYALPINAVHEVIRLVAITLLPNSSPEVLGVINLRGVATFVLDFRQRHGFLHKVPDSDAPLLLISAESGQFTMLVDRVNGVLHLDTEPTSSGLVQIGDRFIPLLDPDKLPSEHMVSLLKTSKASVV